MTIFMKGMVGFATIFFASFLSLGFQLSNQTENVAEDINDTYLSSYTAWLVCLPEILC